MSEFKKVVVIWEHGRAMIVKADETIVGDVREVRITPDGPVIVTSDPKAKAPADESQPSKSAASIAALFSSTEE